MSEASTRGCASSFGDREVSASPTLSWHQTFYRRVENDHVVVLGWSDKVGGRINDVSSHAYEAAHQYAPMDAPKARTRHTHLHARYMDPHPCKHLNNMPRPFSC